MGKNVLSTTFNYDFQLYGIVSGEKEHKLAWSINQSPHFDFTKSPDIKLEFVDNVKLVVSNFTDVTGPHRFTLLKNRLVGTNSVKNQLLLPELKAFDFFLKLESSIDDFDFDPLISSLRKAEGISYLVRLNLGKIKHKENLLY